MTQLPLRPLVRAAALAAALAALLFAPDAAAQAPSLRPIYLPLVGQYTRDELATPQPAATSAATAGPRPSPTSPPPATPASGRWTNVTLSRHVTAMHAEAGASRLWVGTTSGLVVWDTAARTATKVTVADGLLANSVTAVHVDPAGRVWVGHQDGVSMSHDRRTWQALRDEDGLEGVLVNAIVGDPDGGTWFATYEGLMHRASDGTIEVVRTPEALDGAEVTCGLRDRAGRLWFGTDGAGLARRDATGGWRVFTNSDGLPSVRVSTLAEAPDGRVWIGTAAGAARAEPSGTFTAFNQARTEFGQFELGQVDALAVATSGEVWLVASRNAYRLDAGDSGKVFESYDDVFGTEVLAAAADGAIWFGFELGLARFSSDSVWSDWTIADPLPSGEVRAISADGGDVWIATPAGAVSRNAKGGFTSWQADAGAFHNFFYDMAIGPDGSVWHATGDGLITVQPDGELVAHHLDAPLPLSYVAAVGLDAQGRPWIGTGPGAARPSNLAWRGADGTWHPVDLVNPWTGQHVSYIPKIVSARDGSLWIVGDDGLYHIDRDGGLLAFYDGVDLGSSAVLTATIDDAGRIWAGSTGIFDRGTGRVVGGGVTVIDGDDLTFYAAGLVLGGATAVRDIAFDRDGGTWLATDAGLTYRDAAGRWTQHRKADGVPAEMVSVAVDAAGGAWAIAYVGEEGNPDDRRTAIVHRARGGRWTPVPQITTPSGVAVHPIGVLADPAGGVVFGAPRHIVRQSAAGIQRTAFSGVDLQDLRDVATADGQTWFAGAVGVARRRASGTWRMWTASEGLPDGIIRAVQPDPDRGLWIGLSPTEVPGETPHGGGVAVLGPDGTWQTATRQDGLASNHVNDLVLAPDGALWVATEPELDDDGNSVGGGVSRRDPDGTWRTFTVTDGLLDDWTACAAVTADGSAWFGSLGGLNRRAPDGTWSTLPTDGAVLSLTPGLAGDLWIGTSDGAVHHHPDGSLDRYTPADGLGDLNVTSIGITLDAIWFGHLFHGLSRLTRP